MTDLTPIFFFLLYMLDEGPGRATLQKRPLSQKLVQILPVSLVWHFVH